MIKAEKFGICNGQQVTAYTLYGKKCEFTVMDYGATLVAVRVPDKNGVFKDVLLGYDSIEDYVNNDGYFGASIGRVANRVGGAKFTYLGKEYDLFANDGLNSLHGGKCGFDKKIWKADIVGDSVIMTYTSPDGEEGYFGELQVEAEFKIVDDCGVSITYTAVTDSESAVNLTNHAYFNLNGEGNGDILGHYMQINSSCITEIDSALIPNGRYIDVINTPFDFNKLKRVGDEVNAKDAQLEYAGGYDHNFVLDRKSDDGLAAVTVGDLSGIVMKTFTNQNGLQFYCGNFLDGKKGKGGKIYNKRCGLCLEAQSFPNALNVENFGKPIIRAGETYRNEIKYVFSVERA